MTPRAAAVTGYNAAAAAAYADQFAQGAGHYYVYADDCTNFVSQALSAGGYKQIGAFGKSPNPDTKVSDWWVFVQSGVPVVQFNSNTWSVAINLQSFLTSYGVPKLKAAGTSPGSSTQQLSGVKQGDLMFYDWDSDGNVSHVAIQTGNGTDAKGYVGNWVDEHTTNRLHAFWSLYPYNSQWKTTTIHKYTFQ